MEVLAKVPDVRLWKIDSTGRTCIANGEWSLVHTGTAVLSIVSGVQWRLTPDLACLRTDSTSFVFAIDPSHREYFCVSAVEGISEDELSVIEAVLASFCQYRQSQSLDQAIVLKSEDDEQKVVDTRGKSKTDKVVQGVGKVSSAAVHGLKVSSEFLSKKIAEGGDAFKTRTDKCTTPKPVSETTKKRVEHIKQLSKGAAFVAHAAMEIVSDITAKVAGVVVDSLSSKTGAQGPKTVAAKRVGASMLVAAGEIWDAMEDAFKTVAKASASTTADVVEHKYGPEAGKVSYEGMSAVGNAADTLYIARRLGPKVIAKSAAKKVAAGIATDVPGQPNKESVPDGTGANSISYPKVQMPQLQ